MNKRALITGISGQDGAFLSQFLLEKTRRVVIKLGTGILTSGIGKLDNNRIRSIGQQVAELRALDLDVIVVSSGAIGLGMGKLNLKKRPSDLATLQACAAIGQTILIDMWQDALSPHGITAAQILLTREDLRGGKRHISIKNSFEKLLELGIVPVVNENDTVSTEEIKFGDNDVLSAIVASLTQSQLLIILSVISGLLDKKGTGKVVTVVEKITAEINEMAQGTASETSVGGMTSKIEAARIATRSGCGVFIGSGRKPGIITDLLNGKADGTFFIPGKTALALKKRWLAFFENHQGTVYIDDGAGKALLDNGRSLLAKGVTHHKGKFEKGAVINIETADGGAIARGISQFSHADLKRIIGKSSKEIAALFPNRKRFEIVHRDSMVMLA